MHWADLGAPVGSAPGYRRPVVVVSADSFNRSRIATVVVVAITSNIDLERAPATSTLPAGAGGLDREAVVNVSQVVTLDKSQLGERSGTLDATCSSARIDAGMVLASLAGRACTAGRITGRARSPGAGCSR